MKVAIIGAGGAGGYFGGRWAEAGHDVHVFARGDHLTAIRAHGLRIESPMGNASVNVSATNDAADIGPADVVVVATKTWQLIEVLDAVRSTVGPESTVFGLQNGVEAGEVLSQAVGSEAVMGGTCRIISYVAVPGVIRHVGIDPTITFGELGGGLSARARAIAEALDAAPGLTVEPSEDILADLWRKFLFFAPVSALGSVTQVPIGVFRSVPELRPMLEAAIGEVFDVATALGISLDRDDVVRSRDFIDSLPAGGTSSMQRDFRDGRRTELDALSGALVRLGKKTGVPVPVHEFLYAVLLPRERIASGALTPEE